MVNEQVRDLKNRVTLAGIVAELEKPIEGTSNGVPYFSFRGKIQCGADPKTAPTLNFKTFVKAKKANGEDSKNYVKVKDWYKNATSIIDATNKGLTQEEATKVKLIGSLVDNAYMNSENKLVESTTFNMQLFNEFDDYAATIILPCYIANVTEEMLKQNEDEIATGRLKVRLISRDIFNNTLDLPFVYIPEDVVDNFSNGGYEKGVTATLTIVMETRMSGSNKSGGFGIRNSSGFRFTEMVVRGAEPPEVSDDKILGTDTVKIMMQTRKSALEEIKNSGYKGKKVPTPVTPVKAAPQPAVGGEDDIFDSMDI